MADGPSGFFIQERGWRRRVVGGDFGHANTRHGQVWSAAFIVMVDFNLINSLGDSMMKWTAPWPSPWAMQPTI